MTKDEIIEMAKKCGWNNPANNMMPLYEFAKLVAQHERERIKQANAPEIERVNAHIKQLEDAVLAEREACALIGDSMDACQDGAIGEAIRARGQT
jgi:hypothetical protein